MNGAATGLIVYQAALTFLLFITVMFANFAEALAEARGKAQADSLRQTRADTPGLPAAKIRRRTKAKSSRPRCSAPATTSRCEAGQVIPSDGEVVEGIASVDESAITGETPRSSAKPAATTQALPVAHVFCRIVS